MPPGFGSDACLPLGSGCGVGRAAAEGAVWNGKSGFWESMGVADVSLVAMLGVASEVSEVSLGGETSSKGGGGGGVV